MEVLLCGYVLNVEENLKERTRDTIVVRHLKVLMNIENYRIYKQEYIIELRNIIKRCVPEVKERIAWSMPLFEKDKHSISLADCKKHISLYVDTKTIEMLKPQLSELEIKKNALYIPYDKDLPIKTIENVIRQSFDTK